MAPGTQLVFLYLYYGRNTEPVNLTQIAKELSLSKATCTRAINDLTASGLITQNEEGTHKWITPAYGKPEFLKKGYERLKSPVERRIYVKTSVQIEKQAISGIRALAQQNYSKRICGNRRSHGNRFFSAFVFQRSNGTRSHHHR